MSYSLQLTIVLLRVFCSWPTHFPKYCQIACSVWIQLLQFFFLQLLLILLEPFHKRLCSLLRRSVLSALCFSRASRTFFSHSWLQHFVDDSIHNTASRWCLIHHGLWSASLAQNYHERVLMERPVSGVELNVSASSRSPSETLELSSVEWENYELFVRASKILGASGCCTFQYIRRWSSTRQTRYIWRHRGNRCDTHCISCLSATLSEHQQRYWPN